MREVVTRHLRRTIIFCRESKQTPTKNATEQRPENNIKSASIKFRRAPRGKKDADDRDNTARNLQQRRFVAREAEAFDQNRLEAADRSIRNGSRDGDDGEKPSLRIGQALDDLVRLEVLVFDPGLVLAESFHGRYFLCV